MLDFLISTYKYSVINVKNLALRNALYKLLVLLRPLETTLRSQRLALR